MPRTVESITAAHAAATARRAAGRPIWGERINVAHVFHDEPLSFEESRDAVAQVFHHGSLTFEERRDAIVRIVMASRWYRVAADEPFSDLLDIVDELGAAEDVEGFDAAWDALYDQADRDRVWIVTC